MQKVRIGIISTANIATRSIIPALTKLNDKFIVQGIASRNKNKAQQVAKQFNINAYDSYEKLICSGEIDALYIPLPNSLHYKFASLALSEGIHVLVEKSLGCSYKEVEELVTVATKKNVLLMENFQFRFHSQLTYLINEINNKTIGDIRSLNVAFCFPPFPDKDNIRYAKELGGGALLDAGAYTTKISSLLLGKDLKVEAGSLNSTTGTEVDIWGTAFLKQNTTGLTASLTFGFDHYYQCGVQIIGSKGKISTNRLFTARDNHIPIFEMELNGQEKKIVKLPTDDHFKNMLNYFFEGISNDTIKEKENIENLIQSSLIEGIKSKANVR